MGGFSLKNDGKITIIFEKFSCFCSESISEYRPPEKLLLPKDSPLKAAFFRVKVNKIAFGRLIQFLVQTCSYHGFSRFFDVFLLEFNSFHL